MKTIIIKLSGKIISQLINNNLLIDTINKLNSEGNRIIIIHGGGKQISNWADKLGIESNFIGGQRITTKEMMEVVTAVQGGLLNKQIVSALNKNGIKAIGISGVDGNLFNAEIIDDKLGFVGKPKSTGNPEWIDSLLDFGFLPVLSSICADSSGNLINVNADYFVEEAVKLFDVNEVYFLSDISGVFINGSVAPLLTKNDINRWIASGEINDGMIPKINSAMAISDAGVDKIWIGDSKSFENISQKGGTEIVAA